MKNYLQKILISLIIFMNSGLSNEAFAETSSRKKRSAPTYQEYFWSEGKVPYKFEYNHFQEHEINKIETQMRALEKIANIQFIKIDNTYNDKHINIINGEKCSSIVGMQYSGQSLSLNSKNCLTSGTIQHELIHALGFHHEQSRFDRDKNIKINGHNFDKQLCSEINYEKRGKESTRFGEYDLKSIMHYSSYACGIKYYDPYSDQYYNSEVFRSRKNNELVKRAKGLSQDDKDGLIKAYGPLQDTNTANIETHTDSSNMSNRMILSNKAQPQILLYALDYKTQYLINYVGYNQKVKHSEVVEVDPKMTNSGIIHPIKVKDFEWVIISAHEDAGNIKPNTFYYHVRKSKLKNSCFMTYSNNFQKCKIIYK